MKPSILSKNFVRSNVIKLKRYFNELGLSLASVLMEFVHYIMIALRSPRGRYYARLSSLLLVSMSPN